MKNKDSRIELYSNQEEFNKDTIGGINSKIFCRVNDNIDINSTDPVDPNSRPKMIQDSALFGELFQSLMSDENRYITSFNELFDSKYNSFYIPKFVPVLCKNVLRSHGGQISEIMGSRLSNLMGYDTVFNIPVDSSFVDNELCKNINPTTSIFSVDFLPFGWDYSLFNPLIGKFNHHTSLKMLLNLIDTNLKNNLKEFHAIDISDKQLESIKIDFVKQYLFRVVLCADSDFGTHNSGIMFNANTHEVKLLPNFDMEYMFFQTPGLYENRRIKDTMDFCVRAYPEVLQSFMHRLQFLDCSGQIHKVVTKATRTYPEFTRYNLDVIRAQIDSIYSCYELYSTREK